MLPTPLQRAFQLDWEQAQAEFLRESHRKIVRSADAGGGREWRGLAKTIEAYLEERDATKRESMAPTKSEIDVLGAERPELFARYGMAVETFMEVWQWLIDYRGASHG